MKILSVMITAALALGQAAKPEPPPKPPTAKVEEISTEAKLKLQLVDADESKLKEALQRAIDLALAPFTQRRMAVITEECNKHLADDTAECKLDTTGKLHFTPKAKAKEDKK